MNERMDGWMDGWMGGRMVNSMAGTDDGGMNKWMDG
jgi:hypothetical protein